MNSHYTKMEIFNPSAINLKFIVELKTSHFHFVHNSLSGIIHVLYAALNHHLSAHRPASSDSPDDETEECGVRPSYIITEDEANMAVILTEYFQEQRKVYEKVNQI